MAAYDLEEQEQLDALRDWWKLHARTVVLAIGVFAVVLAGGQGWLWYGKNQRLTASMLFESMQQAISVKDLKRARDTAGQLMDGYARTAYAGKAALMIAQVNHAAGDATAAKAQLQWALEKAGAEEKDLARLRLAGVLLDEKKPDEALKLLDAAHDPAYAALFLDLKGDVLVVQGKTTEARSAYQTAVEKADRQGAYRRIIQLKLDALGDGQS